MRETETDLRELKALLERSATAAKSGALRHIFHIPERGLSAQQVVARLEGVQHVALATVTAAGEPRVAPLDALFYRGRFHISSGAGSMRVQHLRRRPAVSLTYFDGDELAIIVHGTAMLIPRGHADAPAIDAECVAAYGSSAFSWSPDTLYMRIEPRLMFTFARAIPT